MGQKSSIPSRTPPPTSSNTSSSILEGQLSRREWDDARIYLKSLAGCNEVQNVDGLIMYQGRTRIVTPPLWTAIFHRAPIDIVQTMYNIRNKQKNNGNYESKVAEIGSDLLAVALESSRGPNDQRRQYDDPIEYFDLIKFLIERSPPSSLVDLACTFKEAKIQKRYTPLGHAISNRKVSKEIVQYLCFICPQAIDIDCILVDDGNEYDISILALSIGQYEKRDLILRGSNFYKEIINTAKINKDDDSLVIRLPPPDNLAVEKALRTAANHEEWQVVKDILPLLTSYNDDDNGEKESPWVIDIRNEMDHYFSKKKKSAGRDEKLRKYFGVVMYDVDIVVDLVSTVMPKRGRKRNDNDKKKGNFPVA